MSTTDNASTLARFDQNKASVNHMLDQWIVMWDHYTVDEGKTELETNVMAMQGILDTILIDSNDRDPEAALKDFAAITAFAVQRMAEAAR